MTDLKLDKTEYRKKAKLLLNASEQSYFTSSDKSITEQLLAHIRYKSASTVFCYVSAGFEVDTHLFIRTALSCGKRICVPLVESRESMTARLINGFEDLTGNYYGIPEPSKDAPILSASEIDLCIVPCVCCDKDAFRVGHGRGYYDRFLSVLKKENPRAYNILLCRGKVVFDSVPHDDNDIRCEALICE